LLVSRLFLFMYYNWYWHIPLIKLFLFFLKIRSIRVLIWLFITTFDSINLPYGYGAGHMKPELAMDPRLVYDLNIVDYLRMFSRSTYTCSKSYNMLDFKVIFKVSKETSYRSDGRHKVMVWWQFNFKLFLILMLNSYMRLNFQ
jgi:hypothetical protein